MTREEKIELLEKEKAYMLSHGGDRQAIALDTAIKALRQESCENAISREKAKQFLYERLDRLNDDELYDIFSRIIDDMYNELPSVTPQQKVGKWIYDKTIENWRCSECNETPKIMGYVGTADFMAEHFRFCNHCGIKMKVSENNHRK